MVYPKVSKFNIFLIKNNKKKIERDVVDVLGYRYSEK